MLIDFEELIKKYKINISGVIHVGGHVGEEIPIYKKSQKYCENIFKRVLEVR